MGVVDDLVRNNAKYAEGFEKGKLPIVPAKHIAIVSCMDARLKLYDILGLEPGDAHVIRNAGGVVTDDVVRSLLLSQRLLETREILLVHHTDCGMLRVREDEMKEEIRRETGVRPAFALEAFPNLEDDVRQSVQRIERSPFIAHKDSIRGFVYEVETGRLREVKP